MSEEENKKTTASQSLSENLNQKKPIHFNVLSPENVENFMERRIGEFSNRYAELYCSVLGVDKEELSKSVQQKIKSSYTKVTIEGTITGLEAEIKLSEDGSLISRKKGDPLIAAAYTNNRDTGDGEFKFKPYADQDDATTTKTIYHEFLHALGGTMRPGYDGLEKYSSGVQFDYGSRYLNFYQPFEEGFTEIIAAEMAGVDPQTYTYEVPTCVLIRKIIGDKSFLQAKSGDIGPLLSEFSYEKLEELRDILSTYEIGMRNRFANAKYVNRETRSIEIRSTETIVNEYVADESYISASKRLTSFFEEYFTESIENIRTQTDVDVLVSMMMNYQTTEQSILPLGNFYESSMPAINQAIISAKATLENYCKAKNFQIPDGVWHTMPIYVQDRREIAVDYSVSDLQLKLLEQEITNAEQNASLTPAESILLMAKKWIYTSIETQKKDRELFPNYLDRHVSFRRQFDAIRQLDPDYRPKYALFENGTTPSSVPDLTFVTNNNISFTKGSYHGALPDYGLLIAKSLNVEFLKSIFGDSPGSTNSLGIEAGILKDLEWEKAKGYLKEIKEVVAKDELSVIHSLKELSEKKDGLPIDPDTLVNPEKLKDLRVTDILQLRI